MNKNKLRIVIADNSEPQELLNFLGILFDVELLKPVKGKKLDNLPDLIIFTDGEVINPESLGFNRIDKLENFNNTRDNIEIDAYYNNTGRNNILKLGIGRGAQLLSHFVGAQNIQYVEGHLGTTHGVTINGWGSYNVNSNHNQMMYPYNLRETSYEILGYSKNFRSKTYLNSKGVEIKINPEFLETEIVKYNRTLCFQFCPENTDGQLRDACLSIIHNFIQNKGVIQKNDEYEPEYEQERSNSNNLGGLRRTSFSDSIKVTSEMPKYFSNGTFGGGKISGISQLDRTNTEINKTLNEQMNDLKSFSKSSAASIRKAIDNLSEEDLSFIFRADPGSYTKPKSKETEVQNGDLENLK